MKLNTAIPQEPSNHKTLPTTYPTLYLTQKYDCSGSHHLKPHAPVIFFPYQPATYRNKSLSWAFLYNTQAVNVTCQQKQLLESLLTWRSFSLGHLGSETQVYGSKKQVVTLSGRLKGVS